MGIYFRNILLFNFCANNCVQRVFEKKKIIFPPFFIIIIIQWKVRFLWTFLIKDKKDAFSQPPLFIFTKGAEIFGHDCIYNKQSQFISSKQY